MILTIWRHGEAERGTIDRQRQLTEAGCDDVGFGCHQFHEACIARDIVHPDLILYSPWMRAAQTAEVIATAFTHAQAREETALQPVSDVAAVDSALGDASGGKQHILLVSHQPLVSLLATYYLGDGEQAPPLTPGGLVTLSLDVLAMGCGLLRFWALPPEYEAGI